MGLPEAWWEVPEHVPGEWSESGGDEYPGGSYVNDLAVGRPTQRFEDFSSGDAQLLGQLLGGPLGRVRVGQAMDQQGGGGTEVGGKEQ